MTVFSIRIVWRENPIKHDKKICLAAPGAFSADSRRRLFKRYRVFITLT
jgi:hypothetical protein